MSKLKDVRVLTGAAMLLAVSVILSFFKIPLTEVMEIRFANIPVAVAGMLFGPGVGGAVGALSDILGYVVRPTGPYFPGFTITGQWNIPASFSASSTDVYSLAVGTVKPLSARNLRKRPLFCRMQTDSYGPTFGKPSLSAT